jgi:hypothetical protein
MRRLTSSEKWKIIQPGPSLWDKRLSYMQIGKARESPFDDVCESCLVSDVSDVPDEGAVIVTDELTSLCSRFI